MCGMKAYVGVTDAEWAAFLAERPVQNEVNFWRPSSRAAFRVLDVGEPFFFKSRYPENKIIVEGFAAGSNGCPCRRPGGSTAKETAR